MSERGMVRAECPTCGPVIATTSELTCGVSEGDEGALCEFACPTCDRLLILSLAPVETATLLLLGAHEARRLPFELLEPHSGPVVSWDEVLDAHFELETHLFPQQELSPGRAA